MWSVKDDSVCSASVRSGSDEIETNKFSLKVLEDVDEKRTNRGRTLASLGNLLLPTVGKRNNL